MHGRMAVGFLDPLGRGGKPSNIPGGICCLNLGVYGRMADGFLDPLGRGGKPSNIPGGICWLKT